MNKVIIIYSPLAQLSQCAQLMHEDRLWHLIRVREM